MIGSALEVTEDMFGSAEMSSGRTMKELAELVDGEGDVWPRKSVL